MEPVKTKYTCTECSSSIEVDDMSKTPVCCSKAMKKIELEPCTHNLHAEMARNDVIEDACDDGRGQQ